MVTDLPIWSLGKGSGGPALFNTLKKYTDDGWDVYLISDVPSNYDCPLLDEAHNIVVSPTMFKRFGGIKKIGLLFRYLDHQITTRRFTRLITRLAKKPNNNTVLYAYEIFGVKACNQVAKAKRVPLVTRFQGTVLSQFPNNLVNRIRRYPHYQALSCKADLIIMTDDGTCGDAVIKELSNESRLLFLRNGFDLMTPALRNSLEKLDRNALRSRIDERIQKDDIVFLTVSRLETWKKVDRAIKGFADYLKHEGSGWLVIVGDGASKDALRNLAHDLGVIDRVVFTGALEHERVYEYMLACDIFLSLYDLSNLGNPLFEAMILGKCIVTIDVGNTSSVVVNNANGILLNTSELNHLGDVLLRLSNDQSERKRLSEGASLYASENLTTWKDRMGVEAEAVLSLLESNGR